MDSILRSLLVIVASGGPVGSCGLLQSLVLFPHPVVLYDAAEAIQDWVPRQDMAMRTGSSASCVLLLLLHLEHLDLIQSQILHISTFYAEVMRVGWPMGLEFYVILHAGLLQATEAANCEPLTL